MRNLQQHKQFAVETVIAAESNRLVDDSACPGSDLVRDVAIHAVVAEHPAAVTIHLSFDTDVSRS